MRTTTSLLIAGFLVGVLTSTVAFALLVRHTSVTRGDSASAIVLKLGHSLDQKHPVHHGIMKMAELLEQKSGGTVVMHVFPNGQLGSETDCIEQLQRGALAMAKTSTAPLESFISQMAVFGIPYAFRDSEHFWQVCEGPIGRELLDAGHDVGLKGLCFYDAGSRNFYTINRAILKPEDLAGLKIRVQESKTSMDMVEALGGSPTPIPWGELYTALQTGTVDGAENNPPSFYSNRHFEVCKHLTMNEHTRVPDILLISQKVWDGLPPQAQQWVQEAADESVQFQRALWEEKTAEVLAELESHGVSVHYPDTTPFAVRVEPMHESYHGTQVGNLLEEIKAVGDE
jgi:tripartite ATP-independent transporter DctP family solute receptor